MQAKIKRRTDLHGVLLVDKPKGLSSAAVVAQVKRRFSLSTIGHGGTLDPFATGLLILLIGEATKIARYLLEGKKEYEALAHWGFETDTEDATGQRIDAASTAQASPIATTPHFMVNNSVSVELLREHLPKFLGHISQVPPRFSALKVAGRPLYDYARAGEAITPEPRTVEIQELELQAAKGDSFQFRVRCGGGTYIRSLARDWARSAGGQAHLQELRRTRVGELSLDRATTLAAILAEGFSLESNLISIASALPQIPQIACDAADAALISGGRIDILQRLLATNASDHKPHGGVSNDLVFIVHPERMGAAALVAIARRESSTWCFERVFRYQE